MEPQASGRPLGADFGRGRETTTPLVPLGEHALRGIAAPCAVFTLPGMWLQDTGECATTSVIGTEGTIEPAGGGQLVRRS